MKVPFYKKKEYYALAGFVLGGVKLLTPQYTTGYQVADYVITFGLPMLMGFFGISDAKKYGTPSGLSKAVDGVTSLAKKPK